MIILKLKSYFFASQRMGQKCLPKLTQTIKVHLFSLLPTTANNYIVQTVSHEALINLELRKGDLEGYRFDHK